MWLAVGAVGSPGISSSQPYRACPSSLDFMSAASPHKGLVMPSAGVRFVSALSFPTAREWGCGDLGLMLSERLWGWLSEAGLLESSVWSRGRREGLRGQGLLDASSGAL